MISDTEVFIYFEKWTSLASLQRKVIMFLKSNGRFTGSYSDFIKAVGGFNNENKSMNNRLIRWLARKEIIFIDGLYSKKRVKTFWLSPLWLEKLYFANNFSYKNFSKKKIKE